jgi:hypothetical protein
LAAIRLQLAFRHSECDKRLTGESPDGVYNVPPKRAEIGRIRELRVRLFVPIPKSSRYPHKYTI